MEPSGGNNATCSRCGAPAGTGLIFCKKCGAALRTPVSLSEIPDGNPTRMSALRRVAMMIVKSLAAIAGIVFVFWLPKTGTDVLIFGTSIVVLLICFAALSKWDDDFINEHVKQGYWPEPLDWSPRPDNNGGDKRGGNTS